MRDSLPTVAGNFKHNPGSSPDLHGDGASTSTPTPSDADPSDENHADGCSCGYCDGVQIHPADHVDPRTGETTPVSFERMSRRLRCPRCGGINHVYRSSYVAHLADLVRRRDVHTSGIKFLTVTLRRGDAKRAGVDGWADSYQVLTGRSGPWTRARDRIKYHDDSAVYIGCIAARPSDNMAHVHAVVLTGLSRADLRRIVHQPGLDVHVKTPDDTDSADGFAACMATYLFNDAARSPSARMTASRGVGYDSERAVSRRRKHVQQQSSRAPGSREEPTETGSGDGVDTADDPADQVPNKPSDADESGERRDRAPPVSCSGTVCADEEEYEDAVRRALMARLGTTVPVKGKGNCNLLAVHGLKRVWVRPTGADSAETVEWREIRVENKPIVLHLRRGQPSTNAESAMQEREQQTDADPVKRFNEAARYSRVSEEQPDGSLLVVVTDHETGETVKRKRIPASEYEHPADSIDVPRDVYR